jgi:hypothetical protein
MVFAVRELDVPCTIDVEAGVEVVSELPVTGNLSLRIASRYLVMPYEVSEASKYVVSVDWRLG